MMMDQASAAPQGDKINLLPEVTANAIEDASINDIIPFYFNSITPETNFFLHFRAFLDAFNDNYTGNWNSNKYLGRADNFYTYGGFERSINIGFKIAAQTREEMKPLYRKAATLASVTAPTYGQGGRFMRGSIAKVTVGDYIYEQPGIIDSVSYTWQKDYPWEISFENCRKKSLYEAVENIVHVFLKDKTTISYVQYFLDLVLERNVKYQTSIADFLEYWKKSGFKQSIPSPEGEKAIRIMTIHKSKGLEFPVVIYPFADDSLNPRSNNIWIPMEDESVDMPQALVKNNKILEKYNDTTQEIYQTKSQEEILDTINVLYVALTRAEEQLHIISSYKITTKGEISTSKTLASYFINFLSQKANFSVEQKEYAFGNPKRQSQPKLFDKNKAEIQAVNNALDFSSIKIAKKEALMWGTLQQDAIEFGNIIHQILSYITTKNDLQMALTKSLDEGLIQQSQKSIFEDKIKQIIHLITIYQIIKLIIYLQMIIM